MDKNAIKKYAVWARTELITRVSQRAEKYDITAEADANASSVNGVLLSDDEKKQRKALIDQVKQKGFDQVMEEVAYTWFNRFIALRFMEVNGYLPSHIRVFTDDNNNFKPQILAEAIHLELDGLDMEKVYEMKNSNQNDELYKYLIIVQCNELSRILLGLFQQIADYTELLFPDNLLREGSAIEQLVVSIPETDWNDQVQVIGWLYQYYNSEPKDRVFAELKKQSKITKENIPAATQLFTPDWIVRYMAENSVGKIWMSKHADSHVKDDWNYYLSSMNDDEVLLANNIKADELKNIKIIDPCAGSGHICVYVFDLLIQMYEAEGYTAHEAVTEILSNNIFALDVDERAVQLAYFALMMKARQYDRRLFNSDIQPNVFAIKESNNIDSHAVEYLCGDDSELKRIINVVLDDLRDAKEYGSLIQPRISDLSRAFRRIEEIKSDISIYRSYILSDIEPLFRMYEILANKYNVVITNPPYMGNKGFTTKLLDFITKYYKEGKIDLYAAFIKRCSHLTATGGIYAMVVPESWMFLSRFEKLRRPFLSENSIVSLLHLGFGAFDSGFGTVAFIAINKDIRDYKAVCYRLVDFTTPEEKEKGLLNEKPFYSTKKAYYMVDGVPICYWVSEAMLSNFEQPKVKDNGRTCVGLLTGNNERFLRYWFEIDYTKLGIGYTHEKAKTDASKKWFPINQYGEYRKWYGNNMIVFDWWNDGFNIKKFKMDRYLAGEAEKKNSMCWNEDTYFEPGITWNRISTSNFSARMSPAGNTAGSSSPIYFPNKREYYLLALFNSCVFHSIVAFLNPTVSFQTTDIEKVPVIYGSEKIDELAKENVAIAKQDWDSFETSYGFKKSPLI